MRRVRIGTDTLSVLEIDPDDRAPTRFRMRISGPTIGEAFQCDDIRGPQCGDCDELEALEVALAFLSAAAEAARYPGSDNADMFPPRVMQWADDMASELEYASFSPRFRQFR